MEASFSGGAITSDGGAVLLRQADRMLGLTDRAAQALTETIMHGQSPKTTDSGPNSSTHATSGLASGDVRAGGFGARGRSRTGTITMIEGF